MWQQDGAPAHTLSPKTPKGRSTLSLIKSRAPELVEDWPARSPDLSPIENVWSKVEHHLWTEESWEDRCGFERALKRAWAHVTADLAYLRRVCGSFKKRCVKCVKVGGERTGY